MVEAGGRLEIDPALTEQLIADAGGADALPLLSFTLERLYTDYGADGRLTLDEYNKLGGVQGSIEAAVAQAFAEPGRAPAIPAAQGGPARQRCAPPSFRGWPASSPIPAYRCGAWHASTRSRRAPARSWSGSSARGCWWPTAAPASTSSRSRTRALLRQWPALASWLEADAGDLKVVEGVERAPSEWGRNGRHDAWLDHRAERLLVAERLTAREDFHRRLGEEGNAYLAACRAREDSGTPREGGGAGARAGAACRGRGRAGAHGAHPARGTLVAWRWRASRSSIGLVLGVWQRNTNLALQASLDSQQAALELEQTNLFVELSIVERLRGNLDAALRFAVDAARLDLSSSQSARSLAAVELRPRCCNRAGDLILGGHERSDPAPHSARTARGSSRASQDKTARIWDAATGKQLAVLRGHEAGCGRRCSVPTGRASSPRRRTRRRGSGTPRPGRRSRCCAATSDKVTSAKFSPDGTRIVTGSFDKTARIWDAATAQQIAVLRGHENTVQTARLQPGRIADRHRVGRHHRAHLGCGDRGADRCSARSRERGLLRRLQSRTGRASSTGSDDTTARIWDAATAKAARW